MGGDDMDIFCDPDKPGYAPCILGIVESGFIGFFSLVSLAMYTIILWTSIKGAPPEEEDRCSFRRSIKILSIFGLISNAFQILFLIDKNTSSISMITGSGDISFSDIFESIDQFLYCTFIYSLSLCLIKPVIWPNLRVDSCLYPVSLLPPVLNLLMRIVLVVESRDIYDQSTKEALLMTTNVISSFLLFLVPLTLTIIAAILNSRRQPEHFMKVCIQRMSFLFGPHLFLAAISFSLYTFAFCHSSYDYDMSTNTWSCPDNFVDSGGTTDDGYKETQWTTAGPQHNTTKPPYPTDILTPFSVSTSVVNVIANIFLPTIPIAFLHTVSQILGE